MEKSHHKAFVRLQIFKLQLHVKPYKGRFIAVSRKCTTKSTRSRNVTNVVGVIVIVWSTDCPKMDYVKDKLQTCCPVESGDDSCTQIHQLHNEQMLTLRNRYKWNYFFNIFTMVCTSYIRLSKLHDLWLIHSMTRLPMWKLSFMSLILMCLVVAKAFEDIWVLSKRSNCSTLTMCYVHNVVGTFIHFCSKYIVRALLTLVCVWQAVNVLKKIFVTSLRTFKFPPATPCH